jgi:hypothetical protein
MSGTSGDEDRHTMLIFSQGPAAHRPRGGSPGTNRCAASTGAIAVVLVAIAASSAWADPPTEIGPRFFGGTASRRDACQRLAATRPERRSHEASDPGATEIAACLQLLRAALPAQSPDALAQIRSEQPSLSIRGAQNRMLLHTYRAIQQLQPWVAHAAGQPDASTLVMEIATLEAEARDALRERWLAGGQYAANLRAGVVDAEPGGAVGQAAGTPSPGLRLASFSLDFESAHAALGWGWDVGMAFEFGRQPMFRMEKPSATSLAVPAYRDGWTAAQSFVFERGSRAIETAIVGRVGATRLEAAGAAANDVAEWALFFDARAELRWHDRDRWIARLSAQTRDPLVKSYVGIRHDQRFHRAGDLSEYDDPTGRLFFGFVVTPVRVSDPRGEGSGNTLLTVGGGFEFEGAVRGPTRLPSGFKIFAIANLDLRRALHR